MGTYSCINNFVGGVLNSTRRSLVLDDGSQVGATADIYLVTGAPEFPAENAYVHVPAGLVIESATATFDIAFGTTITGTTEMFLTIWDAVDFSQFPDPTDPGFSIVHEDSVLATVGASSITLSLSTPVTVPVGGAWISASGVSDQSLFEDGTSLLTFTYPGGGWTVGRVAFGTRGAWH